MKELNFITKEEYELAKNKIVPFVHKKLRE